MTVTSDSTESLRTGRPEPAGRDGAITKMLRRPASIADAPSDLAAACLWAARRRVEIDDLCKAEDWSDETFEAESLKVDAVFIRAIEEPSRGPADTAAKAALALEDYERFTAIPGTPHDDGERIVLTVLREAAAFQADDADDDVTVEFMAGLNFEPCSFDGPQSTGNDWITKFAPHTVGLLIAEKLLRMTKPETIAFLREVADDGQRDALSNVLLAAQETMLGWASFADLAHTRMLVGGSVLAMEEAGNASALVEA